jgi:paraquat-inducible protein B
MIQSADDRSENIREQAAAGPDDPHRVPEQNAGHSDDAPRLPRPHIQKSWWPFPLVWILPVLAAGLAAYYGFTHLQQRGRQILIDFSDGSGLKANETLVSHLGVQIGTVTGIELSPDKKRVRVNVTLTRSQDDFAKAGAVYWTVRPQISVENVSGLNTVLSGPYIEATPGTGAIQTEFEGLQKAPSNFGPGMNLVLHAPRLEHLSPDAPVYFRGIEVGTITSIQLSRDASGIDVHIFIHQHYAPLVQTDSKFWVEKGADIKGGIFSGLHLKLGSLQEIVSGGVSFATPESGEGILAKDGTSFSLYDDSKKEWLDWSPRIALPPEIPSTSDKPVDLPRTPDAARSLVD